MKQKNVQKLKKLDEKNLFNLLKKYMKKHILLLILFVLFLVSSVTVYLILHYVDILENTYLALSAIIFSYILCVSSFFTFILYFFKKIYYRGNVYIYHILSSFRQGFLISIFGASMIYLNKLWAPLVLTGLIISFSLFSLELMIQNTED